MKMQTFTPTILIVEDDPPSLEILRRRFYEKTSLGVLACRNLKDANRIVMSGNYPVDAVLSDLSFVPGTRDEENGLHDGIDFLSAVHQKIPDMPQYTCSVYGAEKKYQERSRELKLDIREWYSKLAIDAPTNEGTPWTKIERDLYRDALVANNSSIADRIREAGLRICDEGASGEDIVEWVRNGIRPLRRTYLQEIEHSNYSVNTPIRVICEEANGVVTAEASQLGLIIPGEGETVEEALEDLGQLIIEQFEDFLETEPAYIVGYAEKVFEKIKQHISIKLQ